jgi:hypothetical protein
MFEAFILYILVIVSSLMKDFFFQTELAELAAAEERSKLNNFLKTEKNIVSSPIKAFKSGVLCLLFL